MGRRKWGAAAIERAIFRGALPTVRAATGAGKVKRVLCGLMRIVLLSQMSSETERLDCRLTACESPQAERCLVMRRVR